MSTRESSHLVGRSTYRFSAFMFARDDLDDKEKSCVRGLCGLGTFNQSNLISTQYQIGRNVIPAWITVYHKYRFQNLIIHLIFYI